MTSVTTHSWPSPNLFSSFHPLEETISEETAPRYPESQPFPAHQPLSNGFGIGVNRAGLIRLIALLSPTKSGRYSIMHSTYGPRAHETPAIHFTLGDSPGFEDSYGFEVPIAEPESVGVAESKERYRRQSQSLETCRHFCRSPALLPMGLACGAFAPFHQGRQRSRKKFANKL